MNYDDIPEWAVQVACEQLGFEGLWEANPSDYATIMNLAEKIAEGGTL